MTTLREAPSLPRASSPNDLRLGEGLAMLGIEELLRRPAPFLTILDEFGYYASPALADLATLARSAGVAAIHAPQQGGPLWIGSANIAPLA